MDFVDRSPSGKSGRLSLVDREKLVCSTCSNLLCRGLSLNNGPTLYVALGDEENLALLRSK